MTKGALQNLKVLEFCEMVSGPYCTKLLADLGADTIKIEKPYVGDMARRRGPFLGNVPHPERSGLFLYLNTNKMGLTLNMRTDTGKKIFKELVKETDILIESNPPQKMKEMGLDYESLKKINPSLIMTSITPFGQTGSHKDYKSYNLNSFIGSGLAYQKNVSDKNHRPVKAGKFFGDYTCGLTAALATLGAVYACRGKGASERSQHIDISKQEALIALQRVIAVVYPNQGMSSFSLASLAQGMGGLTLCKDGYVIITTVEEHQWKSFVKLLGEPEWAMDPDFDNIYSRVKNAHKIAKPLSEWMMKHTKKEIYHKGQSFSCPIGMVSSSDEVVNSEQMKTRNFFTEIDHKETGKLKYPQAPYRFSKTPWAIRRPAPLLGEHNEEILCNRLNYTKDDLLKFAESRVI